MLDKRSHGRDVIALAHRSRYTFMVGTRNADELLRGIRVVEDDGSVLLDVDEFIIHAVHQKKRCVNPADLLCIVVLPLHDIGTGNINKHTALKKNGG